MKTDILKTILLLSFLVGLALLAGCSTANTDSPLSLVDESGNHPSGWIEGHGPLALPDGDICRTCHGEMLDGGLVGVSCSQASFGGQACHANGPAFHPAGWMDKDNMGTDNWHATAYSNNLTIGGLTCEACHTPPALDAAGGKCVLCHFDIDGVWDPPTGYLHSNLLSGHTSTASFDESVCINCHATNNRFGYDPACHNCHEPFPGEHPEGWDASSVHGGAAKASPGAATGFGFCQNCHGHDFAGDSARACSGSDCHTVDNSLTVPHPTASRWRNEDTPTHTSTRGGNAAVCFDCHEDGANSGENPSNPPAGTPPGCYNGTLCHYDKD